MRVPTSNAARSEQRDKRDAAKDARQHNESVKGVYSVRIIFLPVLKNNIEQNGFEPYSI
jgi:hypothetical protein